MRIKELIKAKGLTQKEFAAILDITPVGLNQLINGKPSYPTLEKFAAALDVPIWQLFISPEEVAAHDEGKEDFCAFIRYKGIHYTADTIDEFNKIAEEIKSMGK